MSMWNPISLDELFEQLQKGEKLMHGEVLNFWERIKIAPVKWIETDFGKEGNGFWVVAICGKRVIWYNDIEEGFNISHYDVQGEIGEYHCEQDELSWAVLKLFDIVKFGASE